MKRALVLAAILGSVGTGVAAADGGGAAPGLDYGNGVVVPGGYRDVALSDGRTTLLESIVIRSGRVARTRYLKGSLGIPLVTYSGQIGGLARDDSRLVLATWPGAQSVTRFVAMNPIDFAVQARVRACHDRRSAFGSHRIRVAALPHQPRRSGAGGPDTGFR